jgi:hypothetical protein
MSLVACHSKEGFAFVRFKECICSQRMQTASADERWNEFEKKPWHQFLSEYLMTPLMTSLPRFP